MARPNECNVVTSLQDSGLSRRQYLSVAAALAATTMAGCTDGDDTGGGEGTTTTAGEETATPETTDESTPAEDGGTLTTTLPTPLNNLDPAYTNLTEGQMLSLRINEPLFRLNSDLELEGLLARDVEISDDGIEWVVSLREGVMFHEPFEREMVADDVVYNFDRITDPDTGASWAGQLDAVEEWSAIDDYTIRLTLGNPTASLRAWLGVNGLSILSPEAIEEYGDARNHPVGTGPFAFEEWQTRDHITLVKNENYWRDGVPHVDELVFRPIDEPSVKITELQTGNIDIIRNTPPDNVEQLQGEDGVNVGIVDSGAWRGLHLNTTTIDESTDVGRNPEAPTANLNIRRAINEAINRNAMVEIIESGYGTPTQEFYPEGNRWHIGYDRYSTGANPEGAIELIDETDFERPVSLNIITASDNFKLRQQGLIAQENLNNAGFDAQLHEYEVGTWVDKFFAFEYDISANGFPYLPDPDQYKQFFHTDGLANQPYNLGSNNEHETVFDLWEEGATESDPGVREEIYTDLQQTFFDDSALIILYHSQIINTWRDRVKNFQVHPHQTGFLAEEVRLDEDA
jgi:ABC-type transport system substrate-binding protein